MNRVRFSLLALFLLPTLLRAQVIVNEIMYYPDPSEPEWVELYNAGTEAVVIEGWTIREDSNSAGSDSFSTTIPSGGYLVITGDLEKFTGRWGEIPSPVIEAGFSYLNNNDGDCVRLRDGQGGSIDQVCYEDAWGGRSGKSLERRSPGAVSQSSDSWGTSEDPMKGTPGRANSLLTSGIFGDEAKRETDIRLLPNPTSDYIHINLSERNEEGDGRVEIIDLEGRLLRSALLSGGGSTVSVKDIPSGLYIVRVTEEGTSSAKKNIGQRLLTVVR